MYNVVMRENILNQNYELLSVGISLKDFLSGILINMQLFLNALKKIFLFELCNFNFKTFLL